jgi:hypothetical protein
VRTPNELRAEIEESFSWGEVALDDPALDGMPPYELRPETFAILREEFALACDDVASERPEPRRLPIRDLWIVAERAEWAVMAGIVRTIEIENLLACRRRASLRKEESASALGDDARSGVAHRELDQLDELAQDAIVRLHSEPWGGGVPDEEDERLRGIPVSREAGANHARIGSIAKVSAVVDLLEGESGLSIEELRSGIPGGRPTILGRETRSVLIGAIARLDARRRVSREALAEALACRPETVSRLRKAGRTAVAA